ncbi:MAG: KGG domain-containing protein [Acidiferrobacteraceae bacterium]
MDNGVTKKQRRGFAAMDPDLVREIARKGGVAAHKAGTAHQFTPEEARAAGRKGGIATHSKKA